VSQDANARWKPTIPLLFARLLHYYSTDAKLRVFRFERWIPGKWMELHRTYLRSSELGVDRTPAMLGSAGPNASAWTPEQEYLNVLLIHQLNTGNLSPGQLDWACSQLRAWSRKLTLDGAPRSPEGFFVDLAGKGGLTRRTGNDAGSMLRYVDTTPVAESLERAIAALRSSEATDSGPAAPINQQRISILEKVRPAVAPNVNTDLRRDPRVACRVSAKVRIGLARISRELLTKDSSDAGVDAAAGEQIEVYAVAGSPRARRHVPDEHDSLAASLSSFSDPMWQVKDRSVAGLRIAASGGIGQALALGALVAVRQSDVSDWVLGVVRRLNKVTTEDAEAGVSIIAERVVPVVLHARRDTQEDLGFVVNGIDVSTVGARFDGLYLPPPSRPDKPLSVKTLIVPTAEYSEGRQLVLTTGRSVYTVALRQLVEQRSDWSWAAIQIVEKRPR
jgi:cyclic-di-GMP-binding protein